MPRDWWAGAPSSSTSTTEGFIGSVDIADAEVITRNLRASAVTAATLSTDSVTTDKMTDATVTSCKISTNALTRTVVIPYAKLLTTWGANLACTYVLYKPLTTIRVTGFQAVNLAAMENSTADQLVLFRNSSACVAGTGWTSISTAPAAGTLSCVGSIPNPVVAANTELTLKTVYSTCSVSAFTNVILQFTSTE